MSNRGLTDAAWAEIMSSTISGVEWQNRVQNGYKGKPYNWQATAFGRAKALLDQIADCEPPPVDPPPTSVYWGARIDGQFYVDHYGQTNASDAPWGGASNAAWNLFEQHAGKKVALIHWGGSGSAISTFDTNADAACRSRGAFSAYTMGAATQDLIDLASSSPNANGAVTRLQTWAAAVASTGRPLMLRPWWEMNGNWGYKWQTAQGVTAATYVAAWRTMHDTIAATAPNVSFFWCPNIVAGVPDPTPWFPGASYVDWVGFDGYIKAGDNKTPEQLFGATRDICIALAPGKPLMIGETGVDPATPYGKAKWISDFLGTWLPANPSVKAFSWFNEYGSPNLPHIEVGDGSSIYSGSAQAAFAAGIANARFTTNVVSDTTFPPNAKIPIP